MDIIEFEAGSTPLLVSMPHTGTDIPDTIAGRMTEEALRLPDTDWHVHRLYDFAAALGAARLRPRLSRYVIDLNRAPDDRELYAGARNTELCPSSTFHDRPLYRDGAGPDADEVAERRERYWRPYHDRLAAALAEIRERHGLALLYDAHSIASRVPRFFEGRLPDLNLGTADGVSCEARLARRLTEVLKRPSPFSHVVDGRFKGGYIARHYGCPAEGVHAVQMELSQVTYMDESWPWGYREDLASGIRPRLRELLEAMLGWAAAQSP